MSLTFPLLPELKSPFLPIFHKKRKKRCTASVEKRSRTFNWSLNKHSSIAGSRSGNSANFGSRTVQFWVPCSPLQAIPCLCIMQQKKDSDRSGLHLLEEIPLSCNISLVWQFFTSEFARLSAPSQGLCRIFSTLVKGFEWAINREIPFQLERFGIALETSGFSRRYSISSVFLYFHSSFLGWALLRALRMCSCLYWNYYELCLDGGNRTVRDKDRASRQTWVRLSFIWI